MWEVQPRLFAPSHPSITKLDFHCRISIGEPTETSRLAKPLEFQIGTSFSNLTAFQLGIGETLGCHHQVQVRFRPSEESERLGIR
jgi:hypothetical protein